MLILVQIVLTVFLLFEGALVFLNGLATSLPLVYDNYLWIIAGIFLILLAIAIWLARWQRWIPMVIAAICLVLLVLQGIDSLHDAVFLRGLFYQLLGIVGAGLVIWESPNRS